MSREHPETNERSDADLLRKWQTERDESAFSELVRRHETLIRGVAHRRLRDMDAVSDVVTKTFATLAQRPERAPADHLAGWLAQTSIHIAQTEIRSQQRRSVRERFAMSIFQRTRPTMSPHTEDLALAIECHVMALRPEERDCVLLHVVDGRPFAEVALQLGISEDAARMRTNRAIDRVRRKIGVTSAAIYAAFDSHPQVALSPSECHRLVQRALAAPAVGVGGTAISGWILMTTTQKIGIGLAAALLLLGTGAGVAIQNTSRTVPRAASRPNLAPFVGDWSGKLTYIVRRTGRKVSLDAKAAVRLTRDGMNLKISYGDPAWGVNENMSFSPDMRTLYVIDKSSKDKFNVKLVEPTRISVERHVDEPGRPREERHTLSRDGDTLLLTVEEKLEGKPWVFANEHRMERAR